VHRVFGSWTSARLTDRQTDRQTERERGEGRREREGGSTIRHLQRAGEGVINPHTPTPDADEGGGGVRASVVPSTLSLSPPHPHPRPRAPSSGAISSPGGANNKQSPRFSVSGSVHHRCRARINPIAYRASPAPCESRWRARSSAGSSSWPSWTSLDRRAVSREDESSG